MEITTTDGQVRTFIDMCAHCELDTAGGHEVGCPCDFILINDCIIDIKTNIRMEEKYYDNE